MGGGQALNSFDCMEKIMLNLTSVGTFFNYFDHEVHFHQSIKYDQDNLVCLYLFADSRVTKLSTFGLVDTFLVSNMFRFQKVNSSSSINSQVTQLALNGYNYKMDESILHPLVFEQVTNVLVMGSVVAMQSDLFKPFSNLIFIDIAAFPLVNFFHQVGVEWTASLRTWCRFFTIENMIQYNVICSFV
jgi:hypothetical protein